MKTKTTWNYIVSLVLFNLGILFLLCDVFLLVIAIINRYHGYITGARSLLYLLGFGFLFWFLTYLSFRRYKKFHNNMDLTNKHYWLKSMVMGWFSWRAFSLGVFLGGYGLFLLVSGIIFNHMVDGIDLTLTFFGSFLIIISFYGFRKSRKDFRFYREVI